MNIEEFNNKILSAFKENPKVNFQCLYNTYNNNYSKDLNENTIKALVMAYVRHNETKYDEARTLIKRLIKCPIKRNVVSIALKRFVNCEIEYYYNSYINTGDIKVFKDIIEKDAISLYTRANYLK